MITRGTTPTIEFTFKNISPKDMKAAYLTIDQNGRTKIEKNIDDAIVGENSIDWNLTQEETLKIKENIKCDIQMRYRLNSGLADASPAYTVDTYRILKDGVI